MELQDFLDSDKCPKYVSEPLVIQINDENEVLSCREGNKEHYKEG